jgi:hypothetical protein
MNDKRKENFRILTGPLRQQSGQEKATEESITFRSRKDIFLSSRIVERCDLKPSQEWIVAVDETNKRIRLIELVGKKPDGIHPSQVLRFRKASNTRIYARCRPLFNRLNITGETVVVEASVKYGHNGRIEIEFDYLDDAQVKALVERNQIN